MPREMLGEAHRFLPRDELLTCDEIGRLAGAFASLGVRKIRLTGGEPLLRAELPDIIRAIASVPADIALTTNGSLLARQAQALRAAGLRRVTVSLDSLEEDVFQAMNDCDFPATAVLDGIEAAVAAGLAPVKINAVVRRGVNDHTLVPLARHFKRTGHTLRFIEYMDAGNVNAWRFDDVVPGSEIVRMIDAELPLEPIEPNYPGEVARRWSYHDGSGEIGVIASVTQPFCADCTRARLSADGVLYTCLFATNGTDLRALLRCGASDDVLVAAISGAWQRRADRYSELRSRESPGMPRVEMSYIGG
jgi:cyclic pyranopterin phosphate synthase